jgi:general nucleoside transport system permease protein
MSSREGLWAVATGLAAAWLAFALLVWGYGEAPATIAVDLARGTWAVPYGMGQVLYKATPLLLTGMAVDLALRAGLFNIGAEGQVAVAGLAVATLGARLPAATPAWVALAAVFLGAPLVGGAWAAIPALLRARYGAHEVISTIMMNRIADATVGLALARGLAIPGTVRTPDVVAGARLPRLDTLGFTSLHGSAVSLAFPLALLLVALVASWLARSQVGREIALVGMSPTACAAERIPVSRRLGAALLLSGAVAGVASLAPVLGDKGYFENGLGAGVGFGGIAVALLGRGRLPGLVLAALFFGTLEQGGLVVNARLPMEAMTVVQAVVIVVLALANARARSALRWAP